MACLRAESANSVRLPSQASSRRRATSASPVNATTNVGSGCPGRGGFSTKFGLAQYGQVCVRTPSNARLAPQWPHEKLTGA